MADGASSGTPGLDQVLAGSILRVLGVFGTLATLGAALGQGLDVALGVGAGAALVGASGCALVYLVVQLLDPRSTNKGALGALLAVKSVAVLGLAWFTMHHVDPAGFAFGLVTGVFSVVYGAQRGQASPAGQAAMAAQERAIVAMEDEKTPDSPANSG